MSARKRSSLEVRRFVVVVVSMVAAAPLTLDTYLSDWRYQSPLAELAFVPLVGVALLVVALLRFPYVRTARLGRVDWALAGAAVGSVAAIEMWDLVQPGSYTWVFRLDALSIPLVAFAAVVLLYGVRSLVAFYPGLLVLWLAWPLPVAAALEVVTGPVTDLTARSVEQILVVVPLAQVVPASSSDLVLSVSAPGRDLLLQVSSACSGVGGLLGFTVIGIGLLCVHEGRLRDKARWLATGLLVVFACNVLRILLLVIVAAALGESAAIDVFHPVAGLVLLNASLYVMLVTAERFRLRRRSLRPQPTDNPLHEYQDQQAGREAVLLRRVAGLLVTACLLGVLNAQYAEAAPAYRNQALQQVWPLSRQLEASQAFGHLVTPLGEERWSRRYFGAN
jgi:exosortase/archaeosortase family protein